MYKIYRNKKIIIFAPFYILLFFIPNSSGDQINQKLKWKKLDNLEIEDSKIKWEIIKEKNIINLNNTHKNNEPLTNTIKSIDTNARFKKFDTIAKYSQFNYFLEEGQILPSIQWKSSFDGGEAGGIGHQNVSTKIDYGLNPKSLISITFSESDDRLFNKINNQSVPNDWHNLAITFKRKIFETENLKDNISFVSSLEYWKIGSGSKTSKSIFNQKDNLNGKQRFEKFVSSFSLPYSKKVNRKITLGISPGVTLLPNKLGNKSSVNNFYGNNFFLRSAINFDLKYNLFLNSSYTLLFGPGSNFFNESLIFSNKNIYSYGISWNASSVIGVDVKITNAYGGTPATSLLTIPSDNKPLYFLGFNYKPFLTEEKIIYNQKIKNYMYKGLTVNNALINSKGKNQITFDFDSKGNIFSSYGYSLSNNFQLELLNLGRFNDVNIVDTNSVKDLYLSKNNFHYRFGGKIIFLNKTKGDNFWLAARVSVGRNGYNNQGYLFSELISTHEINNRLNLNINPKHFWSGRDDYFGIGISNIISLTNNFQLIPEINYNFSSQSEFNSTIALRYICNNRSIDIYVSDAVGLQGLGQIQKSSSLRYGIRKQILF